MSNPLTIPVTAGSLPQGFCPDPSNFFQSLLNGFSAKQSLVFPDTFDGVNVSATTPTDTTRVWIQLNAQGQMVRLYTFASGSWLSPHPLIPGMAVLYPGTISDINTFDGGDAMAPSATSGPMWQIILAAKFPIGAGTLASGLILAPGATGGEENHILTIAELAAHTHPRNIAGSTEIPVITGDGDVVNEPAGTTQHGITATTTGSTGADTPHNTMPPYQAVTFVQRTTRVFYTV